MSQKERDATDAAVLLRLITSKGPLELNEKQKEAANEGLGDVVKVLGTGTVDDWKKKLEI